MRVRMIQEIQIGNKAVTGAFIACCFGSDIFVISQAYPYRRLTCIAVVRGGLNRLNGCLTDDEQEVTLIPFPGTPKTHLSKHFLAERLRKMRQRVLAVSTQYIRRLARASRRV